METLQEVIRALGRGSAFPRQILDVWRFLILTVLVIRKRRASDLSPARTTTKTYSDVRCNAAQDLKLFLTSLHYCIYEIREAMLDVKDEESLHEAPLLPSFMCRFHLILLLAEEFVAQL